MCVLTLKSYFLFISGLGGLFSGLSFKLAGSLWASLYKAGTSGFYNLLAAPLLSLEPTPRVCYNLFKVLTGGIIPILGIIVVIFLFFHWHSCRLMVSFISFRRKKAETYLAQKRKNFFYHCYEIPLPLFGKMPLLSRCVKPPKSHVL